MAKLLIAQDMNHAKKLSKLLQQQKIRRIHKGIYTDDMSSPMESIVLKHWMKIVAHIVSGGILSYRTSKDLKPTPYEDKHIVFITSSYSRNITLPGLIISVIKGNKKEYIEPFMFDMFHSNMPRMLLENLSTIRVKAYKGIKTIGRDGVEEFLAKKLQLRGEKSLNQLRDEAKQVAKDLGMNVEYKQLRSIISALLNTHTNAGMLKTPYAKAVAKKQPYDSTRVELFENLALYLKKCHFLHRTYQYRKTSYKNLSFFEAYFSNYIEGTEFLIDEAEDIAFKGIEIQHRHADSHDVLANFTLTNNFSDMSVVPKNEKELIKLLQQRHSYLMKERPEINPGNFKQKPNKAGNTYFVEPDYVVGTLCQAYEIYNSLNPGIERAWFIHFVVSEVHPFDDGNGRLSRVMLNAELVNQDLYKIIIPSVCRDNYLNGLRLASRDNQFITYCKVLDQMQAYTTQINWLDYGEAREQLELDNATFTSDEGLPTFNRALRKLSLSEFPI